MKTSYRLGTGLARIHHKIKEQEFITTKLLIIMGVVAVAKIAVLLLWV